MIENKPNFTSKNTGILLISHGSRHPIASETFNKIADMFRLESDFKVNVGYMEIHKPNIPQAINELVEGTEINTIIAVPVFLAHGIHTTQDIPKILGFNKKDSESENHHNHNNEAHKHHHHKNEHQKDKHHHDGNSHHHHHDLEKTNFDGKIIYTEPLGADPLVVEIIKNRVNTALKK